MKRFLPRSVLIPLALAVLAGGGAAFAQLDGADRGIPPIDSTSNFEVMGVEVDVSADTAHEARLEGWRRAQSEGWKLLWSRTRNRPVGEAPDLSESVLSSIVSGIVIDQEQIAPGRYIARLGVLFDRARTGEMLGVEGFSRRSAPMLVIPVMRSGGTAYSFEYRNPWQRAWAQFRTAGSPVDYVRTTGTGADPLILHHMQTRRPGRGWWRMILDQYGASDIVIPEVELKRAWPGGPAIGIFTARYGPDAEILGRFRLRVGDSAAIPRMLEEGVRRLDAIYTRALEAGLLRPDPTLVIEEPEPIEEPEEEIEDEGQVVSQPERAPVPTGAATAFRIQVPTPDPASVQQAEISVSRVRGVTSAITTSLALGGTSTVRVTFVGDAGALAAALQAQGWKVEVTGPNSLRISR